MQVNSIPIHTQNFTRTFKTGVVSRTVPSLQRTTWNHVLIPINTCAYNIHFWKSIRE
uniref:Uncharacterized protein n=1 Tax=Arundo donax TaxID=35708 RepID=A0A0A9A544_ARUDO